MPRPASRFDLLAAAVSAMVAVSIGAPWVAGQVFVPRQGIVAPDGGNNKEGNSGVYVRDSAVAAEKMALGERMERLKEWDKAADIFQEILEKYPDRVVQSSSKKNQYTSVTLAVQQRLAQWPADGLRAYTNRYESAAADLLNTAQRDDLTTLNTVFQRYFVTEAGKTAAMRMIDLYLEGGEFSAAAWLADRLVELHPSVAPERAKLLYRAGIAYHLAGDAEKAKARLDDLKNSAKDVTGTVRGQDVVLSEALEKELAQPAAVARNLSPESWPVFMGDPSRSRISTGQGRAGARPFSSIELQRVSGRNVSAQEREQLDAADRLDRDKGLNIGIIPSVDRGQIFFQDGTRLYGVGLDSGAPLPGWAEEHTVSKGQYVVSGVTQTQMSRRQQLTVTLTDKEVLAVMGQTGRAITMPGQVPVAPMGAKIVCLDRTSGREKWTASPREFPDQGNVRALSLVGSPLVVGDNVYVCGTGGKSAQFDDCYVFCLDLATGKHKWSAYVCSSATGRVIWGGDTGPVADAIASVSYASGRLYVLSNLGAVASLDAYSGAIIWLDTYDRVPGEEPRFGRFGNGGNMVLPPKPWTYNPAVVTNNRVYALPTDGRHLMVYDAGTGNEIKKVNLTDLESANTLIGVSGKSVVVSSDTRVIAIDPDQYDPAKFTAHSPAILWASPSFTKSPINGRSFMTADCVFIPTRERLCRASLNSGRVEDVYPPYTRAPWEDPEGPGNVIVTEDKVIIAGPTRVSVYTDLAVARAKLDKEVAAAPKDAELRLRYAEMMFVAGDIRTSMEKLDEAIGLLGGVQNMTPGKQRDRAFHTALTFAQRLTDPKSPATPQNRELSNRLFDEAASAASSPSQQVEYRVSRAKFAHVNNDFATEVKLYQEILSDEGMRAVALGDPQDGTPQQAAVAAELAIGAVMRQAGPQVYDPYERAAREAMGFAKAANKPDDLLLVARRYPNASAAAPAMLAAADAFEAAKQHRQATQVLRQLYFKYPQAEKMTVLESMARNYLAIPGHLDVAISRLAQGARLAPEAKIAKTLPTPDGKTLQGVTFADAAAALKKARSAEAVKSLPNFSLPPSGKGRVKPLVPADPIAGMAALVLPLPDYSRADRAVAFTTDGRLAAMTSTAATLPLWSAKVLEAAPAACAWVAENNLAVWNGREVAVVAGDTGTVLWRQQVKSLPQVEVVRADEGTSMNDADNGNDTRQQQQQVFIGPNRRIRVLGRGQLRINGGFVVNVAVAPPAQANPQAPGGAAPQEQLVSLKPAGDKLIGATSTGRLFACDLADGRVSWQTRLASDRPVERLLATDDFAVARLSDGATVQLIAVDAASGQVVRRWDNFDVGNGQAPVSQALSPDGVLVFTTQDRARAKDLYEPGNDMTWEFVPQSSGNPPFLALADEDQLIARDGRVLAASDAGTFVRVLSLETGQPIRARAEGGSAEVDAFLSTGARPNTPVHLRLAGPSLYVFGPQSLKAYNLDNPLDASGERSVPENANLRDVFVGSDFLVALSEPGVARFIGNPDAPSNVGQLLAYSRAIINNRESGLFVHDPTFTEPTGITTWQPATGGFFYLTTDQKLHFLKANTAK